MFRSPDAGTGRPALVAAVLLMGLAVPALGADWQPITGSQPQTTPRSPSQPSGSGGGYGGIMTWGRGGGVSGEPDHPHPPVTSTPAGTTTCGLRIDPPTALPGEYATVIATLPDAVARDLGRLDLLVGGQVATGVIRQGSSFTYAFRVPEGERHIDVSLTAYAARTGSYGQIRTLCTASASLAIMELILESGDKVPRARQFTAGATVRGGQPPYKFEWYPPGEIKVSGNQSTFFTSFDELGFPTITVFVTDAEGRTLSKYKKIRVVGCAALVINGPQELKVGQTGRWTATYASDFSPYRFQFDFGTDSLYLGENWDKVQQFSATATFDSKALRAWAEDKYGCRSTVSYPIKVTTNPARPARTSPAQRAAGCQDPQGCACPGGGRTWQVGQTCCGSVICQPGARCVAAGVCR